MTNEECGIKREGAPRGRQGLAVGFSLRIAAPTESDSESAAEHRRQPVRPDASAVPSGLGLANPQTVTADNIHTWLARRASPRD